MANAVAVSKQGKKIHGLWIITGCNCLAHGCRTLEKVLNVPNIDMVFRVYWEDQVLKQKNYIQSESVRTIPAMEGY